MKTEELNRYLRRIKKALKNRNKLQALEQIVLIIDDAQCYCCDDIKRGGKGEGRKLCESCYSDGF